MYETLTEIYKVLRSRFPTMGARRMVTTIRQDYSIKVPEYVAIIAIIMADWISRKLINDFLKCTEPDAVAARKSGWFKRKWFWSAGIMEYLSIDQHDKWGRFGLWLHLVTDPFNSRFTWLKICGVIAIRVC